MLNFGKLISDVEKNLLFFAIMVAITVLVFVVTRVCERILKKYGEGFGGSKSKINRMTIIAMLSAISFVLMFFEFPLPFAPSFYELDFSELPVIIGAFMLGPTAGAVIEGIKILLHIVIKGTSTAFVGDFANFILGCCYVIPAAMIYGIKKNRKYAIGGFVLGTVVLILSGTLLNAYFLLPKYAELYGVPIDSLIAAGTAINHSITNIFTFVALAVAPFNLIKGVLISVISGVLYKYMKKLMTN